MTGRIIFPPRKYYPSSHTKYRFAQQNYGYGYIGLLACSHKKGNRNRKLPQQIIELIDSFIKQSYETYKQPRKYEVYGAFCLACEKAGIADDQIPSYKTFIKEINRRSNWEQTLKREGNRAAYQEKPFYWELDLTTRAKNFTHPKLLLNLLEKLWSLQLYL